MKIKCVCRVCAAELEVQESGMVAAFESGNTGNFYIIPCQSCIASARVSARNAGYENGYDAGYSDGWDEAENYYDVGELKE